MTKKTFADVLREQHTDATRRRKTADNPQSEAYNAGQLDILRLVSWELGIPLFDAPEEPCVTADPLAGKFEVDMPALAEANAELVETIDSGSAGYVTSSSRRPRADTPKQGR